MVFPSSFVAQPAMYRNSSAASGTSAPRATVSGLPLSSDSSWASSSRRCSMRSPRRQISFARSAGSIRLHGPASNAARAAATALSMSTASPSAAWAMTSPVDGSWTANVFPDAAGTHCPPIRRFLGREMNFWTGSAIFLVTASVCMMGLLSAVLRGARARPPRDA